MRQIGYSVLMGLAFAAGACGGFDNTPFRTGTVRGHITEADPAVALVSLVGNPDIRGTVNADGSFLVERVPAGPGELFIVASANKALRLPVVVPGGGSARLEDVKPRAAGFLELKVRAPGHQRVGNGQVSVTGTPFQGLQLEENGKRQVGPLPEGCYTLETSVPGFPVKTTDACVGEDEHKEVKIDLPEPDEDFASRGCSVNGCESGSHCAADGRCLECVSDDQCAPGLSCQSERCRAPGEPCKPCDENEDEGCPSDGQGQGCEELREGVSACMARCDNQIW
ncbi:carboxypeptidase regulatory-like domain-containing protein [Vitiosangium sp. GDMCC 1.1324]|uniref:carboxypeptidase regulatory-like domain-containing protein n=1 Tax=Vitiosangium sp. (strain GDMCC 1.1324) TaxID=2138576 RepID=UPI000D352882|nr:carboxypeptidase regulatory-like domain-containing protein [Vitiosangium sp. GDMCC 1.1324]PTL82605.1 carboxypeptidase regulatory-like domain-containing protein [Vitiosangium sp. GDMCC 1.1324]